MAVGCHPLLSRPTLKQYTVNISIVKSACWLTGEAAKATPCASYVEDVGKRASLLLRTPAFE